MKDKVSCGHYLIIVHAVDRLGGNRIEQNAKKTEAQYRLLSKNLRDFAIKKREFLNAENRSTEKK